MKKKRMQSLHLQMRRRFFRKIKNKQFFVGLKDHPRQTQSVFVQSWRLRATPRRPFWLLLLFFKGPWWPFIQEGYVKCFTDFRNLPPPHTHTPSTCVRRSPFVSVSCCPEPQLKSWQLSQRRDKQQLIETARQTRVRVWKCEGCLRSKRLRVVSLKGGTLLACSHFTHTSALLWEQRAVVLSLQRGNFPLIRHTWVWLSASMQCPYKTWL